MVQSHSHRRSHSEEGEERECHHRHYLGQNDGHDNDHNLSNVPSEIFVRKRIEASNNKSSLTGSDGSSRSSNNTRTRLRFFFARKSAQFRDAFRPKDREHRKSKRPRVADEEQNSDVDMGGQDTNDRSTNENYVQNVAEGVPADDEAPVPPPSYEEALRLGLFQRPNQQERLQTTALSSEVGQLYVPNFQP